MDIVVSLPGTEILDHEGYYSLLSNAEFKNAWNFNFTPP
jgi:hypothetical protein